MTTRFQNDPPTKGPNLKSKLEPHVSLITNLLQKKVTYQDIAKFLETEFSIIVAPSTIHSFVQVRTKLSLKEHTYNALRAIHHLYVFSCGNTPSYERLIEDLQGDSIEHLYQSLKAKVQKDNREGRLSYTDRNKYHSCFEKLEQHWLQLPANLKLRITQVIENNTPNGIQHLLKNHISEPSRANPDFFRI